jgi:hypothetical protein
MPVIEAQCALILVPHDHRHINQMRAFAERAGTDIAERAGTDILR